MNSYRYKDNTGPSDYFHRNVFVGFQEDALGIRDRHIIGVDSLLWGSDYPHQESTFPRSREIIEKILVDCTEERESQDRRRQLRQNISTLEKLTRYASFLLGKGHSGKSA